MAEPDPRLVDLIAGALMQSPHFGPNFDVPKDDPYWAALIAGDEDGMCRDIASVLQERVVVRDDLNQIGVAHPTRSKWRWRVHSSADDCTHDPGTLRPVFVLRDQEGTPDD